MIKSGHINYGESMMNIETIKNNFVNDVKEILKEKLSKQFSLEVRDSVADGMANYMLTSDAFYIGGGYAIFAGEHLMDIYSQKRSKYGTFGDYKFGYKSYDVKYDLDTFFEFLDFELASKILNVMN